MGELAMKPVTNPDYWHDPRHRDSAQFCPHDPDCSPDARCSTCRLTQRMETDRELLVAIGEMDE